MELTAATSKRMKRTLTIYIDGKPFRDTFIIEIAEKRITTTWGTFSLRDDGVWRWLNNDGFTIKPEA